MILADILTSFSRILGDLHATFCDLVLVPSREVLGELNRLTPRMAMDETVETATTRLSGRQGSSPSVANKAGLRAPVVLSEGPGAESFWGFQDMFGPLVIRYVFLETDHG